ncbi:MAG: PQQ-binding-like beta-propeller repeat protein [Armatimonadota bacterium]
MERARNPTHRRKALSLRSDSGRRSGRSITSSLIAIGIPALVAAIGGVAIMLWLAAEPDVGDVEIRLPPPAPTARVSAAATEPGGASAEQPAAAVPGASAPGPAAPASSGGTVVALPGAWPRFRGANFDNISTETTALARSWGPGGPARLWSVQLGEGYAAPAVLNGRVYVLDYDRVAKADTLRCFALADGREVWSQSYPVEVKRNHGMSRTVPAVTNKHVLTLGPKCHVLCADAVTGAVYWRMDLVAQFGTKVPGWYAGQCPLIDGNRAILAPGGSALLVAVDLASGSVVWETPNPHGWQMTHSSVMPMTFDGQRMYVYCASGGVVGVSASDGSILWETPDWTVSTANVPSPVVVGDGRIFLSGGYNSGAMMLRLGKAGGKIVPEILYRLKPNVFGSQQQTPILYKDHIYGLTPNRQLTCINLDGDLLWTSGRTKRFGQGPYLIAGGMLYVLSEDGELALVEPTPAGYQELARAKILNGPEAWGPMAIAGGRLLARDFTNMVCLDVRRS